MKKEKTLNSRRTFIKKSTTAAAGLALSSGGVSNIFGATKGWANKAAINPAISNMRVVCCYDEKMLKGSDVPTSFEEQNNYVVSERVAANLDEMAKTLTNKENSTEAWKTIFRSPKAWTDTKIAFKVNCIGVRIMFRLALIDKLARVLNSMGVPFENMLIYDAGHNAWGKYNTYIGNKLPAGIKVLNKGLGNSDSWSKETLVDIPEQGTHYCVTEALQQDIIINCAVNKGHSPWNGNATLTLKNHYGTFKPDSHSNIEYIFGLFKSDVLSGGTIPRQQLCIIDSLWAANQGPTVSPNNTPYYRIVMGTFSPAVDYATIKNIRVPIMKASTGNAGIVDKYLTFFGYSESDLEYIEINPRDTKNRNSYLEHKNGHSIKITLDCSLFKRTSAQLFLPKSTHSFDVNIFGPDGRLVRKFNFISSNKKEMELIWDARDSEGGIVAPGTYLISLELGKSNLTTSLIISA